MVLCTILKGRSLKSCVALVVFCCSLVVACINPVLAATTSGDPDSFGVYSSFSGGPVAPFGSSPCIVPASGHHVFVSFTPKSGNALSIRPEIVIPEMIPQDYRRTLLINIGFQGEGLSVTQEKVYNYSNVTWYGASNDKQTYNDGCWSPYDSLLTPNGLTKFFKCAIPATATSVRAIVPTKFNMTANGKPIGLVSFGGYVVDTDDQSVVDVVHDILTQVTQINSKAGETVDSLHSAVNVLNSILRECKDINADTDNIISILRAVDTKLISLNGRVDDIYTLLKDSLKVESDAIDRESKEVADQIMQRVDSEQYWNDKNTENFEALDMGNWTFGTGVVGALPTVSNLFKGLWDSFGEAVLIFIFPLMLGLALVIIGRISRHSGKGGKSGGDSD